jgi:plasmid stabilization system protein ParE
MPQVRKTERFLADLEDTVVFIARDNVQATLDLEALLHSQVDHLADPNFPRRLGRVPGTWELVAHPNYVVVLHQTATAVTALAVLHVARQFPPAR